MTLVNLDLPYDGNDPILRLVSGGRPTTPLLGHRGYYLAGHWSMDLVLGDRVADTYPEFSGLEPYGVCDSPDAFAAEFGELLETDPRSLIVSFVRMRRDEQPAQGGWRWHKWGPYVGKQESTMEYLYDEPEIEEVYTYHVYEVTGG